MIRAGLIIDEPWISRILAGEKTWEMRSRNSRIRESIALIRKGSGTIVGLARIVDSHGPFSRKELLDHSGRHRIPRELIESGQVDRWCYAWELNECRPLAEPIEYDHPPGAVIWVKLDQRVQRQIARQLSADETYDRPVITKRDEVLRTPDPVMEETAGRVIEEVERSTLVPYAKDGSFFGPHLKKAGQYTIWGKGEEVKVQTFGEAIVALRRMKTARWRRPNSNGNWGIVSAVRWTEPYK